MYTLLTLSTLILIVATLIFAFSMYRIIEQLRAELTIASISHDVKTREENIKKGNKS